MSLHPSDLMRVANYVVSHPANQGRKLRQINRAAAFRLKVAFGEPVVIPLGSTSKIWGGLEYASSILVAYGNPPDWPEWQFWRRRLKPGDLFVDVGANIGIYSILAAELGCRVIAIEPDSSSLNALYKNIDLNGMQDSIQVVEAAATDFDGWMPFNSGKDALGHLSRDGEVGLENVKCFKLDDLVKEEINGLKIDVEGSELNVLRGATKLLDSGKVKCAQIEWNDRARINFGETRDATATFLQQKGMLLSRPDSHGSLQTWDELEGKDVFACLGFDEFR
jgi:FkbM family methyltransferase